MKKLYFALLFFPLSLCGQTIVNDYYAVTALTGTTATVGSITGTQGLHTLATGDSVLIIQMQGATINQTNTSSFGNVTAVNNAGNYELNVICGVSGNQVAFKYALVNSYTPATGAVQIVSHGNGQLATFTTPSGGVTGQAWNGATGGVVFIKATTILLDNAAGLTPAVSANGIGFRGGAAGGIPGPPGTVCNTNVETTGNVYLWNNSGCNGAIATTGAVSYYYPKLSLPLPVGGIIYSPPAPATQPANLDSQYVGGWKGEGIAAYVTGAETGRGKQANGGGGGQVHNSGGAGGSLYGAGGSGGNQWSGAGPTTPYANGGIGGATLTPSATKLFMGGGGGGGQANYPNGDASAGGNGGGIILFRGTTFTYATGALYNIQANGANNVPKLDDDSEGGGGAGGSIYFDVNTITLGATGLTLYVEGGTGGNSTNAPTPTSTGDCIGPGGGGGGGYILSRAIIPGTVNYNMAGGNNGITTLVTAGEPCAGGAPADAWGAAAGTAGTKVSGLTTFTTPLGTTVVTCVLPISMASFNVTSLTDKILVDWSTAMEENNKYFVVERSTDGAHFDSIAYQKGAGNSFVLLNYSYTDDKPQNGTNYYRIKQVDYNGHYSYSSICSGNISMGFGIVNIYPQPLSKPEKLMIAYLLSQKSEVLIQIMDALGKEIYSGTVTLDKGGNLFSIDAANYPPGIYCLIISSQDGTQSRKVVIE